MSHTSEAAADGPPRGGLVLAALILGAAVANLNLAVANVALPTIGDDLGSSQTLLNMVAVGFTLGLAASVLYLGALADHHGRRLMLLLGLALSVPAAAAAAWAPTIEVLIGARVVGGMAAGMAYPTTLSLVTALFSGPRRTRAIALWSGIGAGASALGPLFVGLLLERFWWGSAFALTIPFAVVAFALAWWRVPHHAGESDEPVDNLGGILSVVLVGTIVLSLNFAPLPGSLDVTLVLAGIAVAALAGFAVRERRATNPLFDLHVAKRRIFWVAALAGIIAFGSLMGALFIGQQFMQDVLGYSALEAGLAIVPSPIMMIGMSPVAARVIAARGARFTLIVAFALIAIGFLIMLTWREGIGYPLVGISYAFVGAGIGLGGAPASRSVMSSVPVHRAGMGSAVTDLQRDLGGAVMQSILGALLSIRYSHFFVDAFADLPADEAAKLSDETAATIKSSFGGAVNVAKLHPGADADKLVQAAKQAFTEGSRLAIAAGVAAILVGLVVVVVFFPGRQREDELERGYAREDEAAAAAEAARHPAAAAADPSG